VDSGDFNPKIVAFLCTWCSYAGADLAGTGRNQYPPNIRIIRIPCSGRINPIYIIKALLEGADGVMVSGCHPGDCHYLTGNLFARRRFTVFKRLLEIAGIEPDRVRFTWVSASEGANKQCQEGGAADTVTETAILSTARDIISETDKEDSPAAKLPPSDKPHKNTASVSMFPELTPLCKKLLEEKTVNTV
jgi:coenzyme F420-reducing hydrogenase delta subunit